MRGDGRFALMRSARDDVDCEMGIVGDGGSAGNG